MLDSARPRSIGEALLRAPSQFEHESERDGDPGWLAAHERLLDVHRQKSRGYGTHTDPLANFTTVGRVTGEPAARYPRRRMLEKLARCESLEAQHRFNEIPEELEDIASLALCALALMRREGWPMDQEASAASAREGRDYWDART